MTLTKKQKAKLYADARKQKWFKDAYNEAKSLGNPLPKPKLVNGFHGRKHWEIDY
tara:strand:- start:205 stop:369 length:165 start_codon:yes stop_codon:yes gene_type:complete